MTRLSVCCVTSGRSADRLAAILALYRPVADEIVVAVDDRAVGAADVLAAAADHVAEFPHLDPCDRPIAWLFGLCSGEWILNVDDDEVPSPALVDELPALVRRGDVTHGWIARRWLYPDTRRYLDEPPWNNEFQLRLLLADERFLQFSDEFHRPVVAHGPMRFVEAPLWHLDTAVNSFERRQAKAVAYEHARRGMRIAGRSHNSGMYLPELRPDAATAVVPPRDAAVIAQVLRPPPPAGDRAGSRTRATRAEVDGAWSGAPYPESLYGARVSLLGRPGPMVAGSQQTVDVLVTNDGECVWRWGNDAQPEVRLSYRWQGSEEEGLRTALPLDIAPGSTAVVPVHVVPPARAGYHQLEIDLVHEHVRWFGVGSTTTVEVLPRRRVAVAGDAAPVEEVLDFLLAMPDIEPVLLEPDETMEPERFGHRRVAGLRTYLFGADGRVEPRLPVRTARLLIDAALGRSPADAPEAFLAELGRCDALVVAGRDWENDAPLTRELWRVGVTVAAARALGVPVLRTHPLVEARGLVDRGLLRVVETLSAAADDSAALEAAVRELV